MLTFRRAVTGLVLVMGLGFVAAVAAVVVSLTEGGGQASGVVALADAVRPTSAPGGRKPAAQTLCPGGPCPVPSSTPAAATVTAPPPGRAPAAEMATGTPAPALQSPTLQSPTLQSPTLQSPTLQSPTPEIVDTPAQFVPAFVEYTVGAGDTLLSIAMANQVSMAAIQLANDMGEAEVVRLGQILKLPTARRQAGESPFWIVHVVEAGETLTSIAAQYGIGVDALAQANPEADATRLKIDQSLVVPAATLAQALARPAPEAVAQADPAKAPAAKAAAVAPPSPEQPAAPAPQPIPTPAPLPEVTFAAAGDADAFRGQLLASYNQARAEAGLPPLAYSAALQAAAQGQADDCALRGYGSHYGSDGSTSRTRIARVGYPGGVTGENWAFATSAARAFDMWYTQEYPTGPHRRNILSGQYAEVGFGVAPAGNGGYYVIADFGGQ